MNSGMTKTKKIIGITLAASLMITSASCSLFDKIAEKKVEEMKEAASEDASKRLVSDYLMGTSFRGNTFKRSHGYYEDVTAIDLAVYFYSGASEFDWTYSYTASIDGNVIASEENLTPEDPSEIAVRIESEERFPEGHLVITVTDGNGNEIAVGECDITQTEERVIERRVPPQNIPMYTEAGTYSLPGIEYDLTIPENYTVWDEYHPNNGSDMPTTLTLICDVHDDDHDTDMSVAYLEGYSYQDPQVAGASSVTISYMAAAYELDDIEYTRDSVDIMIGDIPTTVDYIISYPESDDVNFIFSFPFGDDDSSYYMICICRYSPDEDFDPMTKINEMSGLINYSADTEE